MMTVHINQKITVDKQKLLKTLRENRAEHAKELIILKTDYLDTIDEKLEAAKLDHSLVNAIRHVQPPEDHTKDYDQLIALLEFGTDTTIQLSSGEFDQFVQDNWDWKDRNRSSSSFYNK